MEKEQLADHRKAGRIARQALDYGEKLVKEDALIREVLDNVDDFIVKQGGQPAFPAQSSQNDVAAHFCPAQDDDVRYRAGDLVKLDFGVHINGNIADTARSVLVGDGTDGAGSAGLDLDERRKLIDASRAALDAVLPLTTPGTPLWKIGKVIEETIKSRGFRPIRNLSGHGLGPYEIHAAPTIPNFNNQDQQFLEEDQVIAIEPFATTGVGLVASTAQPEIFTVEAKRPVRNPYARDVLAAVAPLNGLPFCTRYIARKLGQGKTRFGIVELQRAEILRGHAPLAERSGGLVSQTEHSIIIADKPIVYTKDID